MWASARQITNSGGFVLIPDSLNFSAYQTILSGGVVTRAPELMHGKASGIYHNGSGVFEGLPSPFSAIRYHSLCAAPEAVPDSLEVTAKTDTGVIMAIRHREYPVHGVQFHPESILTEHGKELLRNFLGVGVTV